MESNRGFLSSLSIYWYPLKIKTRQKNPVCSNLLLVPNACTHRDKLKWTFRAVTININMLHLRISPTQCCIRWLQGILFHIKLILEKWWPWPFPFFCLTIPVFLSLPGFWHTLSDSRETLMGTLWAGVDTCPNPSHWHHRQPQYLNATELLGPIGLGTTVAF